MQPRTNGHQKRQLGSGPGPHTDLRQIKQHTSRYRGNETDSYCCGCTKIVLTPQPHVKKYCNNYWNKRTPLILVSTWNTIQQSSWNPQTYSEILRQSEAQTGREYGTRPCRRQAASLPVCASDCLRIPVTIQDRGEVPNRHSGPKPSRIGAQSRGPHKETPKNNKIRSFPVFAIRRNPWSHFLQLWRL